MAKKKQDEKKSEAEKKNPRYEGRHKTFTVTELEGWSRKIEVELKKLNGAISAMKEESLDSVFVGGGQKPRKAWENLNDFAANVIRAVAKATDHA